MSELFDTNKMHTTPFHPEGDGLSEKINKTLIKMIKTNINDDHSNWDEILPQLQFAYNSSVHATTGVTPFFMMFGREPKCPEDLIFYRPEIELPTTNQQFIKKLKHNMQKAFTIANKNTQIKVNLSKIRHDRQHIACLFEPGETVWARDFKPSTDLCKKFCNKWKGPYTVLERMAVNAPKFIAK